MTTAHLTENNKAVCEILFRAHLAVASAADSGIAELAPAVHATAFEAAQYTYGVSAVQFAVVLDIASSNAHMTIAECVAQMLLDEREAAEQADRAQRAIDAEDVRRLLRNTVEFADWPDDRISRITAAILHGYRS